MGDPFFVSQKRRIASFLRAVNKGTSTTETSLHPLIWQPWHTPHPPPLLTSGPTEPDGFLWACPPTSPHSAGLASPDVLYGTKLDPPTHPECLSRACPQWRFFPPDKGPNHKCSLCRRLRHSAPPCPTHPLFAPPCCQSTVGWFTLLGTRPCLPFMAHDLREPYEHIRWNASMHQFTDQTRVLNLTVTADSSMNNPQPYQTCNNIDTDADAVDDTDSDTFNDEFHSINDFVTTHVDAWQKST
jgi:hypothetical protein